jgi:glycosyltransferase involved in cell wall biosynthesis
MDLATRCFRDLMRHVRQDELESGVLAPGAVVEAAACRLIKHYQGVRVEPPCDDEEVNGFVASVFDAHSRRLYKNPLVTDMVHFLAWRQLYGTVRAAAMVDAWISEQNEHKYQRQCLETFFSWPRTASQGKKTNRGAMRVRYYGPIGTTGYARACADIVDCLLDRRDIDLEFLPLTVQHFHATNPDPATLRLRSAVRTKDVYSPPTCRVDVVLIHSIPDMWIPVVRAERALNPAVRVVGMTVWETDHLPFEWSAHLRWVDRVVFPNEWNTAVAAIDIPGLDVSCLYHPITRPRPPLAISSRLDDIPAKTCVFYTINEFSGRKGIDALLRAYTATFTSEDSVLLVIKTHGAVSEAVARAYVARLSSTRRFPPAIRLEYGVWSEDEIAALHSLGHCYVSLTKAEGQGLGACAAAALGKRVIMTGYGAQTEYLHGIATIDWVRYTMAPAVFCSTFDDHHAACLNVPSCRFFPTFLPTAQQWARPDEEHASTLLRAAYTQWQRGDASHFPGVLDRRFGREAIAASFASFLVDTATSRRARPFPTGLSDPYDRPSRFFRPQREVIEVETGQMTLHRPKPRVTVVGCSGYGNVGDDLYRAMYEAYLGDDVDLTVCNTRTFVGPDGRVLPVDAYRHGMDLPVDYVVIGGGGLLNEAELTSSIFTVYLPYCTSQKVPLAVVSVGFGYPCLDGSTILISDKGRRQYTALLSMADLVTVRSIADRDLALDLIPRHRRHVVRVYPDLVFGCATVYQPGPTLMIPDAPYVILCPTTTVSTAKRDIAVLVRHSLMESRATTLVILPMEGVQRPDVYPNVFVTEEIARVRELFPDVTLVVYTGRQLESSGQTQVQTIARCIDLFRHAAGVVTGRYHGVVLARSFQVPVHTGATSLVKIVEEMDTVLDQRQWRRHLDDLCDHVHAAVCARVVENPLEWDDDRRNTCIVDLVTQGNTTATVEYTQALSNRDIWRRRRSMLTQHCVPPSRTCQPGRVTVV